MVGERLKGGAQIGVGIEVVEFGVHAERPTGDGAALLQDEVRATEMG